MNKFQIGDIIQHNRIEGFILEVKSLDYMTYLGSCGGYILKDIKSSNFFSSKAVFIESNYKKISTIGEILYKNFN